MQTSYTAHGKVILIGEHSVVYGYDALAMPIKSLNIKTYVQKSDTAFSIMNTTYYHGNFMQAPNEYNGLKYVLTTMQHLANNNAPLKITYEGQIPIERGFGSSATVALGTVMAINDFYHLNLSHEKVMDITNHAETINHGKASGLDSATVASDHLVFFNPKKGIKKITSKLGAYLLIMDTGDLGNTKKAVTKVQKLLDGNKTAKQKMQELGHLADAVQVAWKKQDIKTIGTAFNKAQELLTYFGVSTSKINRLCSIGIRNGALGVKLSGGGLGGIVIALTDSAKVAQKIANESKNLIDNYWIEEI